VTAQVFSVRQPRVAAVAFGAIVLQGLAGLAFAAVYGFDVAHDFDLGVLVAGGPQTATVFRLALVLDALSYLAVAPLVLYLHGRLRPVIKGSESDGWLLSCATFFGLAYSVVGSIGATFVGAAGGALIEHVAAGGDPTGAAAAFAGIAKGVYVGLWGPLEWTCAGLWVGGIGWLMRRDDPRFGTASSVVGLAGLAYAAQTAVTGRNPLETPEPIYLIVLAALALFVLWEAWLAVRLWLGR
jgi:hypothetical protein